MDSNQLPLMTQPLDTATPVRQANQDQWANAANHEEILGKYYQNLDAREKSRLSSVISGAVQLESFLNNEDLEGAHNFLINRRNSIQNRIAQGENLDTEDTDAAIQMLRSGNVQELYSNIQALKAAGQVYGVINKPDMPATLQEWQAYNTMSPEDQKRYLTMKRANPAVNLGGTQMIPNPVNPAGEPLAQYDVTLKPEDQPANVAAKEAAALAGRGEIPESEKTQGGKDRVNTVLEAMKQNYRKLDESGAIINPKKGSVENIGAALSSSGPGQFVGSVTGSQEQAIRQEIKNQIPVLISAIRQATGMSAKAMDSNAELQFYLQQASDPKRDIQSNLAALDMIAQLYGSGTLGKANSRIKIRDPKTGKTGTISAEQAEAAKQQGYEVIE